ncbi:DNA-3-methyladenine glycosylase I [Tistrella mobilis]|uniref:DNA-3-methyladenine glycosylase I n=1 Tax=Tistrella mobilis TaxID=171437 RepID=UPI003556B7FB
MAEQEEAVHGPCPWCGTDPLYRAYHDAEWGVPVREERPLFEMLALESFQSGLSWITILRRREGFRRAFAGFDPERVARFGPADIDRLLADPGIIRHRGKIEATIINARAVLALRDSGPGLAAFLWAAVDGQPLTNHFTTGAEVPGKTAVSDALARRLKQAGFRHLGSTTVYAFMQAAGLVNDHLTTCPRHAEISTGA